MGYSMNLITLSINERTVIINFDHVRWIQVHDDGSCSIWFSETHHIGVPSADSKILLREFVSGKKSLDLREAMSSVL